MKKSKLSLMSLVAGMFVFSAVASANVLPKDGKDNSTFIAEQYVAVPAGTSSYVFELTEAIDASVVTVWRQQAFSCDMGLNFSNLFVRHAETNEWHELEDVRLAGINYRLHNEAAEGNPLVNAVSVQFNNVSFPSTCKVILYNENNVTFGEEFAVNGSLKYSDCSDEAAEENCSTVIVETEQEMDSIAIDPDAISSKGLSYNVAYDLTLRSVVKTDGEEESTLLAITGAQLADDSEEGGDDGDEGGDDDGDEGGDDDGDEGGDDDGDEGGDDDGDEGGDDDGDEGGDDDGDEGDKEEGDKGGKGDK